MNTNDDWRPIETVPRTGQKFVFAQGDDMRVLNWPPGCALGTWSKHNNEWYGSCTSQDFKPTVWQQLPPTLNEDLIMENQPIVIHKFTFSNKDILTLTLDEGNYAKLGKVKHYTLMYGEYDTETYGTPEKPGYLVTGSEYFPPDTLALATFAFNSRLNSKTPSRPTNQGRSLEEIAARSSHNLSRKED